MSITLAFSPTNLHTFQAPQNLVVNEIDALSETPFPFGQTMGWNDDVTVNEVSANPVPGDFGSTSILRINLADENFTGSGITRDTTVRVNASGGGASLGKAIANRSKAISDSGALAGPFPVGSVISSQDNLTINGVGQSVTEAIGHEITAPSIAGGAVVTSLYGLKIGNVAGGSSSNFAILTGTGLVRFGDNAQVLRGNVAAEFSVSAGNGFEKAFVASQNGIRRWTFSSNTALEAGANAGSNLEINAYTDAGVLIDAPIRANRVGNGNITIGGITQRPTDFTGPVSMPIYTVAALPAGTVRQRAFVSNALAPVWGAAVAGGGAVTVPVYYDGATWRVG